MDVSKQIHKTHDVFYTEALSSYKTHLFKAQKEQVPVLCCKKKLPGLSTKAENKPWGLFSASPNHKAGAGRHGASKQVQND